MSPRRRSRGGRRSWSASAATCARPGRWRRRRRPPLRSGSWSTSPPDRSGHRKAGVDTTPRLPSAVPGLAVVPYIRDATIGADDLRALVAAVPAVVAVKYAVPDPVRFADLVTERPAAALDLRARGVVGAVLPARRCDRVHVRAGGHRAAPVPGAARAPAARPGRRGARDVAARSARSRRCGRGTAARRTCRRSRRRWRCGPSSGAPSGRRSPSSDPEDRAEVGRILASWDDAIGSAVA